MGSFHEKLFTNPPLVPQYDEWENHYDNIKESEMVVGIHGDWYNVSKFLDKHPGGPRIMCEYFGKDATCVFKTWHSYGSGSNTKILKTYLDEKLIYKVGKYESKLSPLDKDFLKLHGKFVDNGLYNTNYTWIALNMGWILLLFYISHLGIYYCNKYEEYTSYCYLFGVLLTISWQQAAFMMHDAKHGIMFVGGKYDKYFNYAGGLFCGDILFGINSRYWYEMHNIHHIYTNTIDINNYYALDQSMCEIVFITSENNFQLKGLTYDINNKMQFLLLKYQSLLFIPICALCGRIGIMFDSWKKERNIMHLVCFVLHNLIIYYGYFVYFNNTVTFIIFYFIAAIGQGLLHIQIAISHYDKPFINVDKHIEIGYLKRQALVNKDIITHSYFDWFHGGLQYHLLHHALPRLPRYQYRKYDKQIKRLLKEHGITMDESLFFQAIFDVIKHLHLIAKQYGNFVAFQTLNKSVFE